MCVCVCVYVCLCVCLFVMCVCLCVCLCVCTEYIKRHPCKPVPPTLARDSGQFLDLCSTAVRSRAARINTEGLAFSFKTRVCSLCRTPTRAWGRHVAMDTI